MRAERLLRLVLLLQSRGGATAGALARELGVSTRTVQRDMAALSGAGIPVYATRGGGGGWALLEGYRTSLAGLTATDALAIIVGRPHGILAELGLDDPGEELVGKLLATVAATARTDVEHARQRLFIDIGPWQRDPAPEPGHPDPSLPPLRRAIWEDRRVGLRYGTAPAAVLVDPLGLVRQGTNWYLVARRDQTYRTYRVARIRELTLTDQPFTRPAGFDLARHWRDNTDRFFETLPRFPVRLRLRGEAAARAGWLAARAKTLSQPDPHGWVTADLDLGDQENALTAVRTLGNETLVVSPEPLRQAAVEAARGFITANTRPAR